MTTQITERLIFNGEETFMHSFPPIPEEHSRIVSIELDLVASCCWRGYVGTWEIKDGRLYLVALRGCFELMPGEPLFADWVTGVICIPRGEVLEYSYPPPFRAMYEEEIHVKIERGVVVESWSVDNRGKGSKQGDAGH